MYTNNRVFRFPLRTKIGHNLPVEIVSEGKPFQDAIVNYANLNASIKIYVNKTTLKHYLKPSVPNDSVVVVLDLEEAFIENICFSFETFKMFSMLLEKIKQQKYVLEKWESFSRYEINQYGVKISIESKTVVFKMDKKNK